MITDEFKAECAAMTELEAVEHSQAKWRANAVVGDIRDAQITAKTCALCAKYACCDCPLLKSDRDCEDDGSLWIATYHARANARLLSAPLSTFHTAAAALADRLGEIADELRKKQ